ncbi:adenylyltransferase/cytidyltransferase family protein [Aureispira]|nr:adenylyltransferase/cytidyltransferase family protein [Aureispira sp.]
MGNTVITFGTFDIFHIGHLNILKRAKKLGAKLIVGISSDELNMVKKNRKPIYNIKQRLEIISSIKYVDEVFVEESLEKKEDYIRFYNADILVMGDDWRNKFDNLPCKVLYLPRTPSISTTQIIETIINSE